MPSKQTPHTGEHNIGAPDVIQPSPSSENQGWGCSNERATGTAYGSYPKAKQREKVFLRGFNSLQRTTLHRTPKPYSDSFLKHLQIPQLLYAMQGLEALQGYARAATWRNTRNTSSKPFTAPSGLRAPAIYGGGARQPWPL